MIPISVKTEWGGGGDGNKTQITMLYYESSNVIFNKQTEDIYQV